MTNNSEWSSPLNNGSVDELVIFNYLTVDYNLQVT